jgi:hypothetical protein
MRRSLSAIVHVIASLALVLATKAYAQGPPDEPVSRLVAAFNRHDVAGALALYADTTVILTLGDSIVRHFPRPQPGHDPFTPIFTANPHVHATITKRVINGPFVIDHEQQTGWADGKTRDWLEVYLVRKGKIVGEWEMQPTP